MRGGGGNRESPLSKSPPSYRVHLGSRYALLDQRMRYVKGHIALAQAYRGTSLRRNSPSP